MKFNKGEFKYWLDITLLSKPKTVLDIVLSIAFVLILPILLLTALFGSIELEGKND